MSQETKIFIVRDDMLVYEMYMDAASIFVAQNGDDKPVVVLMSVEMLNRFFRRMQSDSYRVDTDGIVRFEPFKLMNEGVNLGDGINRK